MYMPKLDKKVRLVTSITQILEGYMWDGTDRTFDGIGNLLGNDYDLSINSSNQLEIINSRGYTKRVDIGNYVATNEDGDMVLLTGARVLHHFKVIERI